MSQEINKDSEVIVEKETINAQTEQIDDFDFDVTVDQNATIITEICITKGFDPVTQQPKPIVFRKKNTEDQISLYTKFIEAFQERIDKSQSSEERNRFEMKKLSAESELSKLEDLLNSKYITWSATWKKPSFKDSIDIEVNSFTEDTLGEKNEFSEYDNSRIKIKLLLLSWDVKSKGRAIPVSEALTVDPDVLKAFIAELNEKLYGYRLEIKK